MLTARPERRLMTNRLTIIGAALIISSLGVASDDQQSPGATAAHALLQSLPPARRSQAQLPFDSSERTKWNYVPTNRAGVALAELDASQKALIDPLLRHVDRVMAEDCLFGRVAFAQTHHLATVQINRGINNHRVFYPSIDVT